MNYATMATSSNNYFNIFVREDITLFSNHYVRIAMYLRTNCDILRFSLVGHMSTCELYEVFIPDLEEFNNLLNDCDDDEDLFMINRDTEFLMRPL